MLRTLNQLRTQQSTLLFQLPYASFGVMPRKMKVKHMSYTQVPDWLRKQDRDPFDYQLRSKQELQEEQKYFPPDFFWEVELNKYPAGDVREHGNTRIDHRDKVCKLHFDMGAMGLSPEQRERMVFLLGPRYKPEHGNRVKIVSRLFLTY